MEFYNKMAEIKEKAKEYKKNLSTSAYLLWWLYFEVYYILYHIIPLLETAQCFNFLLCLSKRLRSPRLKLINPIVEQKLLCKRTFVPIIGRYIKKKSDIRQRLHEFQCIGGRGIFVCVFCFCFKFVSLFVSFVFYFFLLWLRIK